MKTTTRILVVLLLVICHFLNTEISVWSSAVFYFVIALISILSVIQFWRNDKPLTINTPEIVLLAFVIYLVINNAFHGTFWNNASLYNYFILLLFYFAFVLLYNSDKAIIKFIVYGLFAGFAIELIVGFGQLFGIISNSDLKFTMGGLFGNPGAFGGYLAIVLPFLLVIIYFYKQLKIKSENYLYAIAFCLFCGASLIVWSDSRGAWIAGFISIIYVLNHKYKLNVNRLSFFKTNATKIVTVVVLLLAIVAICFALFKYKQESANGRLFIWKVSKPMVIENPLFGNGFGSFEADYGKVQALYFLHGKPSASEVQIADYVTCAYNEFLGMQIESGVIGMLLFFAILFFAFYKQQDKTSSEYNVAAKASLIAFVVLSMVSYPFTLIPNLLFFVICLFLIFQTDQYKAVTISKYSKPIVLIWAFLILSLVYGSSRQVYGMYYFRDGYTKILNNDLENGIIDYTKAYPFLKNNGGFRFYYGSALYLKHDYAASAVHLQKAVNLRSDPNAFILLGKALQELKRYPEAEHAFLMSTGITPTKLYPKYLLAKLYVEIHQPYKAVEMANSIIMQKEKTPTTAGNEIKTEMQVLISQYSKSNVKPSKTYIMSP